MNFKDDGHFLAKYFFGWILASEWPRRQKTHKIIIFDCRIASNALFCGKCN